MGEEYNHYFIRTSSMMEHFNQIKADLLCTNSCFYCYLISKEDQNIIVNIYIKGLCCLVQKYKHSMTYIMRYNIVI